MKFTAQYNGYTETRNSKTRVYTHAVVAIREDEIWVNGFCGSRELAEKKRAADAAANAKYIAYGDRPVTFVVVEVTQH
jgi:hypothetical protein